MVDRFYISFNTIVQFDDTYDDTFILYQKINNEYVITLNSKSMFYSSMFDIFEFDVIYTKYNYNNKIYRKALKTILDNCHQF